MKNKNQLVGIIVALVIVIGIPLILFSGYKVVETFTHMDLFGSGTLKLLSSLDNKDLEDGIKKYAKEHGFIGWFPTSASADLNVNEAMDKLADAIAVVAKENTPQEPLRDVIIPEAKEPEPESRKCC